MIRGLEKIKSLEEYNDAKKDLEYYVSEYKWMIEVEDQNTDTDGPRKVVEAELIACGKELHAGMDPEEEKALLKRIHDLKTKHIAIVKGEYKPALKRNINGLVLMIEQFEAAHQDMNFGELVKGILNGDRDVKEYLKKKYTFTLANMYGTAPAPESLNVEKMEDILDYMDKNYSLVDIELESREEKAEREAQMAVVPFEEPIVGLKAKVLERTNNKAAEIIRDGKVIEKDSQSIVESKEVAGESKVHESKSVSPKHSRDISEKGEIEK